MGCPREQEGEEKFGVGRIAVGAFMSEVRKTKSHHTAPSMYKALNPAIHNRTILQANIA
jgi:hypothetical protein